jgi:hypothetical protein
MSKYEKLINLSDEEFKRATGIQRNTFFEMIEMVEKAQNKRKKKAKNRGRKSKLSTEDQILMTLEYLREYRTQFHIGVDYNLNETTVLRIIKKIEDILIKNRKFHLPKKKNLVLSENKIEVVLIDATETPIERPKKNKNSIIQEKRKNIR